MKICDSLQIINTALVRKMLDMDADELWQVAAGLLSRPKPEGGYKTTYFGGTLNIEKIRDVFYRLYDSDPEHEVYRLIQDVCFEGEPIPLDYYARCGYLDSGASCCVTTSDELIPFDGSESEFLDNMERFDLLSGRDVERIVRSMEQNLASMTENTAEDIPKVRSIMERCYSDEGYNAAYIYDHWFKPY